MKTIQINQGQEFYDGHQWHYQGAEVTVPDDTEIPEGVATIVPVKAEGEQSEPDSRPLTRTQQRNQQPPAETGKE